jgi:hypothetical protein
MLAMLNARQVLGVLRFVAGRFAAFAISVRSRIDVSGCGSARMTASPYCRRQAMNTRRMPVHGAASALFGPLGEHRRPPRRAPILAKQAAHLVAKQAAYLRDAR